MSEDPNKYFKDSFKNITEEDLRILDSLFNGLKKVLKFGINLLSDIEVHDLKYIS